MGTTSRAAVWLALFASCTAACERRRDDPRSKSVASASGAPRVPAPPTTFGQPEVLGEQPFAAGISADGDDVFLVRRGEILVTRDGRAFATVATITPSELDGNPLQSVAATKTHVFAAPAGSSFASKAPGHLAVVTRAAEGGGGARVVRTEHAVDGLVARGSDAYWVEVVLPPETGFMGAKVMHLGPADARPSTLLGVRPGLMSIAVTDAYVYAASAADAFRRIARGDGRAEDITVTGLPEDATVQSLTVDGDDLYFAVRAQMKAWRLWRAPARGGRAVELGAKLADIAAAPRLVTTRSHLCWAHTGHEVACFPKDAPPGERIKTGRGDDWAIGIARTPSRLFWLASSLQDAQKTTLVSVAAKDAP